MSNNRKPNIVQRHPLAAYIVLAFVLAWWPWPLTLLNPNSVAIIPWSPLIAALIVTAIAWGRRGLKELLASMVRWRVGWRWYAVALLLPAAIVLIATYLNVLLGAPAPTASQLGEWYLLLPSFLTTLLIGGPLTEEPGWRGVALPLLQERYSVLAASLIVGVIWAAWHLPLLVSDVTGQRPPAQFVVTVLAQSVLLAWVYNNTRSSLLMAILFHAAANTVGAFFFRMYIGTERYQQLWWIYAGVYVVAAVVVVAAALPEWLARREQAAAITTVGEEPTPQTTQRV